MEKSTGLSLLKLIQGRIPKIKENLTYWKISYIHGCDVKKQEKYRRSDEQNTDLAKRKSHEG